METRQWKWMAIPVAFVLLLALAVWFSPVLAGEGVLRDREETEISDACLGSVCVAAVTPMSRRAIGRDNTTRDIKVRDSREGAVRLGK
jgi:hypothetical protein